MKYKNSSFFKQFNISPNIPKEQLKQMFQTESSKKRYYDEVKHIIESDENLLLEELFTFTKATQTILKAHTNILVVTQGIKRKVEDRYFPYVSDSFKYFCVKDEEWKNFYYHKGLPISDKIIRDFVKTMLAELIDTFINKIGEMPFHTAKLFYDSLIEITKSVEWLNTERIRVEKYRYLMDKLNDGWFVEARKKIDSLQNNNSLSNMYNCVTHIFNEQLDDDLKKSFTNTILNYAGFEYTKSYLKEYIENLLNGRTKVHGGHEQFDNFVAMFYWIVFTDLSNQSENIKLFNDMEKMAVNKLLPHKTTLDKYLKANKKGKKEIIDNLDQELITTLERMPDDYIYNDVKIENLKKEFNIKTKAIVSEAKTYKEKYEKFFGVLNSEASKKEERKKEETNINKTENNEIIKDNKATTENQIDAPKTKREKKKRPKPTKKQILLRLLITIIILVVFAAAFLAIHFIEPKKLSLILDFLL